MILMNTSGVAALATMTQFGPRLILIWYADVPWVQAQTECSSWYGTPTIKPVTDMVSFSITTLELKVYDDA